MSRLALLAAIVPFLASTSVHAQVDPTSDLRVEAEVTLITPPDTDASFAVTVTNGGPDPAENATMTLPIPSGLTFVSLSAAAGFSCTTPAVGADGTITCSTASLASLASASFTVVLHVTAGTAPGTFFTNVFTVSTSTIDPTSENDSISAVIQTPPPPGADLFTTLAFPAGGNPDADVTYTFGVTNFSTEGASDVTLTFPIAGSMTFVSVTQTSGPPFTCAHAGGVVTCSASSLAALSAAEFEVVGHVPPGTADGTYFETILNVTSASDPNTENDASPSLVCVQADSCGAGPCNANTPVTCPLPDQCHEQSVCDTVTGACPPIPKTDGTACDDASVCTQTDACQSGVCTGGDALVCDDGNACTSDSCDPVAGCMAGSDICDAGTEDAGATPDAGDASTPDGGGDGAGGGGCDCATSAPSRGPRGTSLVVLMLLALGVRLSRRSRA